MTNVVEITKPMTYHSLESSVEFVVTEAFKGPAVTILGNTGQPGSPDRTDGEWPSIDLKCNGLSSGLVCRYLDSAVFHRINVEDAIGNGLTLDSCRQSLFHSIRVTRCIDSEDVPAMALIGKVDATNNCHFGLVNVCNSSNACYLELDGRGCRSNTFSHVLLHTPWNNAIKQWPHLSPPVGRTLLHLKNARNNRFEFAHLRLDQDFEYSEWKSDTYAVIATDESYANKMEGIVMPSDDAVKVLRRRGSRDIMEFVRNSENEFNLSAGWLL